MTVPYHNLVRQVAFHTGALRGQQTQELATSYASPLTAAELVQAGIPLQVLFDAVLMAEEEFVTAVASTGNHPWREALRSFTALIPDKGSVPNTDVVGQPIVGVYGTVRDATDSTPLMEMPLALIARRVRNSNAHYRIPVYWYKFDGGMIRHTRTNVRIDICSYDRTAQAAAIIANANMILPDTLEHAIVQRAICLLNPKHDGSYADAMVAAIKVGNTSVVPKSVPLPVTLEKAG